MNVKNLLLIIAILGLLFTGAVSREAMAIQPTAAEVQVGLHQVNLPENGGAGLNELDDKGNCHCTAYSGPLVAGPEGGKVAHRASSAKGGVIDTSK
jgi:hypothetical protein